MIWVLGHLGDLKEESLGYGFGPLSLKMSPTFGRLDP